MKFLLDYHISSKVASAFARLGGKAQMCHLRDWHGGIYIAQHGEGDLPWLRFAGREGWIIVTGDRNTLLADLALLQREGVLLPGFAVVGSHRLADIGWIARRLRKLETLFGDVEPGNVQVFL